MPSPLSQDYNEAIQDPILCFADEELRAGQVVTNSLGLPMPRSGNFADVYQVRSPDNSRSWAVKCFTREVPGQRERYAAISAHLNQVRLPFAVEFKYLKDGIRVAGRWYPVLKMDWIEGFLLNEFVRQHLDRPAMLEALANLWTRLAGRLRRAGMSHGDLQHGNVLLVPGRDEKHLAIKLIDYDGMFVPALASLPSGEVGHPAYQHPQRLREATYSADVDRFPLLVVFVGIRALMVGGRALWDRFDNGDNLLFRRQDLAVPTKSALFAELLKLNEPSLRVLVETLIDAARKPLADTPLMDGARSIPPVAKALAIAIETPPVEETGAPFDATPAVATEAVATLAPPLPLPEAATPVMTMASSVAPATATPVNSWDFGHAAPSELVSFSKRQRNRTLIWALIASGVGVFGLGAVALVATLFWLILGGANKDDPQVGAGTVALANEKPKAIERVNPPKKKPPINVSSVPPNETPSTTKPTVPPKETPPTEEPTAPPKEKVKPAESSLLTAIPGVDQQRIDEAIAKGVRYLKEKQSSDGSWPGGPDIGYTALAGLTLLECKVPPNDSSIVKAADYINKHVGDPKRSRQHETYEMSLAILFLDRLGNSKDRVTIQGMALILVAGQNEAGGWTYNGRHQLTPPEMHQLRVFLKSHSPALPRKEATSDKPGPVREVTPINPNLLAPPLQKLPVVALNVAKGDVKVRVQRSQLDDNSNTQFALLGLWAARRHDVPTEYSLKLGQQRFLRIQNDDGGWPYWCGFETKNTMTCAGLIALAMGHGVRGDTGKEKLEDAAIQKGLRALGKHVGAPSQDLNVKPPMQNLYFLWSLDRVAMIYDLKTIGGKDWYGWGAQTLLPNQHQDGHWSGGQYPGANDHSDTCFAMLFLKRSNLAPDLTEILRSRMVIRDPM
jgi:hypothetical protein